MISDSDLSDSKELSFLSDDTSCSSSQCSDDTLPDPSNQSPINPSDEPKKLTPEEKMFKFCRKGKPDHIKFMVNKFPHLLNVKDSDGYSSLHKAAYSDNYEVVQTLIELGADIEARTIDQWTPLHCASKWGNLRSASILIDAGANINARSSGGVTPLHLAAANKNKQMIELLLFNPNIDVNIVNNAGDKAVDIARRSSPYYVLFDQIKY
ncbi:ankyrin repeat domain-containing protein 49-like [Panonychus citri]|uniref:ankyrin repeat domain-containing protein 49-like n=1 Tax=Panonychus citri TaxID=50023 RepID=UPI0023073EE5|nr:ankyrin repeat domain-containing protein 49-like [Panonychus citri]